MSQCNRLICYLQEILEDGECSEVENILRDPWFHKMKVRTGMILFVIHIQCL